MGLDLKILEKTMKIRDVLRVFLLDFGIFARWPVTNGWSPFGSLPCVAVSDIIPFGLACGGQERVCKSDSVISNNGSSSSANAFLFEQN